jgi:hypothetical protein
MRGRGYGQGRARGYGTDYDRDYGYGGYTGGMRDYGYTGDYESGYGGMRGGYGRADYDRDYYSPRYGYGGYGAWRGRYTGRGPQGYQRSDDRIREDVIDRLTWHGDIDATNINVKVDNGTVTLDGTVDTRWEKRLAEDIAEDVFGVKDVQNNLRVQERGWQGTEETQGQQGQRQQGQTSRRRTTT